MVKWRLGMTPSETRRDTEIDAALAWADVQVDDAFDEVNESIPSPTPSVIKEIAADYATYFLLRNKNQAAAKLYLEYAAMRIEKYIFARYKSKTLV